MPSEGPQQCVQQPSEKDLYKTRKRNQVSIEVNKEIEEVVREERRREQLWEGSKGKGERRGKGKTRSEAAGRGRESTQNPDMQFCVRQASRFIRASSCQINTACRKTSQELRARRALLCSQNPARGVSCRWATARRAQTSSSRNPPTEAPVLFPL